MERRGFLKLISGGVAGIVLNQAIPFNRVWSFPKEIKLRNENKIVHPAEVSETILRKIQEEDLFMSFDKLFGPPLTLKSWQRDSINKFLTDPANFRLLSRKP